MMRFVAGSLGLALGWLAALSAAPAAAQPSRAQAPETEAEEVDPLKKKAQELLTRGVELASEGDYASALDKFRAAHELFPSPKLLLNIGTSLRHLGRYSEALATYQEYLDHPDADAERASELATIRNELEGMVGELRVLVDEPDTRLSIDGRLIRDAGRDRSQRIDPGEHTVLVEKDGFIPAVERVRVELRSTTTVEIQLRREGEPAPALDWRMAASWGAIGLGALAGAVGTTVGVVALHETSRSEDSCGSDGHWVDQCDPDAADHAAEARTYGTASIALVCVGLAATGVGLALVLTSEDGELETAVRLGPLAAAEAGLALEGRW
jgi:tetratricopeptide (TPR) repeat protein